MKAYPTRGSRPRPKLEEIHFVTTSYRSEGDAPVASRPKFCPYLEDDPTRACQVSAHHLRRRKTGSVTALAVCECKTHGKAFGLYPPGAVPYGRISWSPVSPGGDALQVEGGALSGEGDRKLSATVAAFVPTYPGAAVDEGRGVLWHSASSWDEDSGHIDARRITQVRRSLRSLRVLGIAGGPREDLARAEADRMHLAEMLGVPLAELRSLEATIPPPGAPGAPRARGQAVWAVLEALPEGTPRCRARRLAVAGHLAGLWGLGWEFDERRGTFSAGPFRRGGRVVMAM